MSASSLPMPFLVPPASPPPLHEAPLPARPKVAPLQTVRRRPNMQQGRALETLGHAIEYLVDSRMFLVDEPHTPAEPAAIQLLSRCSREVFATCEEIVPVHQRLKLWASERLRLSPLPALHHTSARRPDEQE